MIKVEDFGTTPDGKKNRLYTLTNSKGLVMKVMNYGGIITHLFTPDYTGKMEDIVLGYDSIEGYVKSNPYFGAIVGRYGNRIHDGRFKLNGKMYELAVNNGPNHLHGGLKGFDKVFWEITPHEDERGPILKLGYTSPDNEEGYPGNLSIDIVYHLTNANELAIEYKASTDKTTVVNLTQHTYFNLSAMKVDILSHELLINADGFIPVDRNLIPIGKIADVLDTPFDFKKPYPIGARITEDNEQLKFANGYDHTWVINKKDDQMVHACTLIDRGSRRQVEVLTTEPGVQFYSGNFLDGSIIGKEGHQYKFRNGLCLETQHFPDSPNQPQFPSTVLEPGSIYSTKTIYRFGIVS